MKTKEHLVGRMVGGLAFAGLLAAAPLAHADWIFNGSSSVNGTTEAGASMALGVSGVSAANNSTNTLLATGTTWTTRSLSFWSGSGLGMGSDSPTGSPNHAIDNVGNTEGVLLNFGSAVALSQIGLGWISEGQSNPPSGLTADISLFRYIGSGTPTLAGTGASLSGMTAASWDLVGNYANVAKDNEPSSYTHINTTGLTSSWWLITAYNASYGTTGTGLEMGNDYFKLYAVAAKTPTNKTPEPGSLALVGLALLGGLSARRRSKKAC